MPEVGEGVWRFNDKCPRCGSEFMISGYLHEIPLIGKVIISVGRCSKCGYRYSDVKAAESKGPQRLILKVEDQNDLNVLVLKAATASYKIPELGIKADPGPASQGFITTVEGLLDRVLEVLELLRDDPEVNQSEREKREKMIKEAIEGKRKFTLIIDDPEGVSRIISDKVIRLDLHSKYIS